MTIPSAVERLTAEANRVANRAEILRRYADGLHKADEYWATAEKDADGSERLAADLREVLSLLEERTKALEPFEAELKRLEKIHWAHPEPDDFRPVGMLTWGDLRRASQALHPSAPSSDELAARRALKADNERLISQVVGLDPSKPSGLTAEEATQFGNPASEPSPNTVKSGAEE